MYSMPEAQHYDATASSPGLPGNRPDAPQLPQAEHEKGLHLHLHAPAVPPPSYAVSATPPSGHRLPLTTDNAFPNQEQTRYPPFFDSDGANPIFIGSAIMGSSVHPCKLGPTLNPPCRVPYGGREYEHRGRYDLLPFDNATMEWVRTSHGRLPPGRKLVAGGYEEGGRMLFHAAASINGCMVPGKTGEHLRAAHIPFGGGEHVVSENYDILCWRH